MSRRTSTIVIAGVVVLVGSPFAFSATRDTAPRGRAQPATGAATPETQIIARTGMDTYGTRQSNLGDGGAAIYGCRSALDPQAIGDPKKQHAVHPREQPRQRQGVRLPGQAQPDRRHHPDRPEPHDAEARLGAVRHERDRRRGRPERRPRRQPQRQRDRHAGRERGRRGDPGRWRRRRRVARRTRRSPAAAASRPSARPALSYADAAAACCAAGRRLVPPDVLLGARTRRRHQPRRRRDERRRHGQPVGALGLGGVTQGYVDGHRRGRGRHPAARQLDARSGASRGDAAIEERRTTAPVAAGRRPGRRCEASRRARFAWRSCAALQHDVAAEARAHPEVADARRQPRA